MRRWRVLAVCGMGLGSSTLLRMQVEKAAKALGVEVTVDVADITSAAAQAQGVDIIVVSAGLANTLSRLGARVISITNTLSLPEMTDKLRAVVEAP
ncbi:MAG TPA: PTS sugar transporter subunit IIB [Anaerolineaceae bacterium]